MQEERPMAGHAPSVVHNSRDVARQGDRFSMINAKAPILNGKECLLSGRKNAGLLSISFQLTDLKEDHEVILGVTGTRRGACHSAELCGRH